MKEWFLGLHPALLILIAIVAFAVGYVARRQFTIHSKYGLPWLVWSVVAGVSFGIGIGLSFQLVALLLR